MERQLPYNFDGSSCFMDSLLCGLFFPTKLRVVDPYLLQGKRANQESIPHQELCQVLRGVAKCIRGVSIGDVSTYRAVRPLLAHYLLKLDGTNFERNQHDPADLLEALLRTMNVGGVFTTRKTVESTYNTGKETKAVSTDQMFRYSVHHSVTMGRPKFESLFPWVETMVLHQGQQTEERLVKQRTIVEFGGGPVLVLTREVLAPTLEPVNYGRWSPSTSACLLPILNTVQKSVQWYELQAVLCWRGSAMGEAGHYVCFVFDEAAQQWFFYNDLNRHSSGLAGLEAVGHIEQHPFYTPSLYGMMFIYALIPTPPSDV
jgi:hypothetical protein